MTIKAAQLIDDELAEQLSSCDVVALSRHALISRANFGPGKPAPPSDIEICAAAIAAAGELLTPAPRVVGVLGAGMPARILVALMIRYLSKLSHVAVFDGDARLATSLVDCCAALRQSRGVVVAAAENARDAVMGAELVFSTSSKGKAFRVPAEWLIFGAVLIEMTAPATPEAGPDGFDRSFTWDQLAEMFAGQRPGRLHADERVLVRLDGAR
ncbi:hypothetical protein [Catelliglobosispora koreensis]|uniref:hypothetical protein n=1 Tax=Catelliglobosispora koreensis TaxID=129052 RepID=UPI0003612171|nr:hypothetical protein [Catelliglobosispora koreensis]